MAQETVLNEAQMDTALRAILGGTKVTVKNVLNIPAVSRTTTIPMMIRRVFSLLLKIFDI